VFWSIVESHLLRFDQKLSSPPSQWVNGGGTFGGERGREAQSDDSERD